MNLVNRSHCIYNSLIIIGAILIASASFIFCESRNAYATGNIDIRVTTSSGKIRLKNILVDLSRKYGWTINVSQGLANNVVSSQFSDEPFNSFLKRVFKRDNIIVTYNVEDRIIDITSFGSNTTFKSPSARDKLSNQVGDDILVGINSQRMISKDLKQIRHPDNISEVLSGVSADEISLLNARETEVYFSHYDNLFSREPLTGLTFNDIDLVNAQENKYYSEYATNPASIEPLTGLAFEDINRINDQESQYYSNNLSNSALSTSLSELCLGMAENNPN